MSGMVGIKDFTGHPVNRRDLEQLLDLIAHRGADVTNIWVEGSTGFAHGMLWTTAESLWEKLPLVAQAGNLVITADARIDNRDELQSQLKLDTGPINKITDSEFILAAYEKWGESCPKHLLGDFAFAIWDQGQQCLFCARDHFGVKPFYYYHQPGRIFLFASELKAVLGFPAVPALLNEVMLAYYLIGHHEETALTIYQDILRLPPAHSMRVSQSGIELSPYWFLDPHREIKLKSDPDYAEAFREIFTEAVGCRLRSVFPIGSHLSGGLDSSAVTCVARQILDQTGKTQLNTFSNIFDQVPECDERPFINAVLNQGTQKTHYIHADQRTALSDLEQIWQYEDQAYTGPSHFLVWGLNHAAHQAGMRVVLDGLDGDNTVSHGGVRLTELVRLGEWETFAQEVKIISHYFPHISPLFLLNSHATAYLTELAQQSRWGAFAQATNKIHQHFGISRQQLWLKLGLRQLIPQPIRQTWHSLRRKNQFLINPNFAKCINLEQRLKTCGRPQSLPLTAREEHWRNLTAGIFPYILERTDLYAAAFSLEARHPFMDKRLIEFCLALPSEQKLNQGWSRMVMRRGLANILPEKVQWRRDKADMTPNLLRGMLTIDRQLLDQVIFQKITCFEQYINIDFLHQAYQRFTSGKPVSDFDLMTVWRATILSLWLHHTQVKP